MTTIRLPRAEDAAALAALADGLSAHEGDPTGNFTAETALRDVIAPGAPVRCLVAEGAGGLEGFVFWHFAYETAYAARGAFVSDLFVSEARRGAGIGRALLSAVARAVKAEGGEFISLTAFRRNERACRFYRSLMEEEPGLTLFFVAEESLERLAR
ncbi:MAG: GNAT family N-acetyltransferase [Pikeienuella sp.]|uniref:GNAT family N-acetyltransferase n=1 Tax=Pikeienuella sp. TaxID=2831957 RepID=UPI003918A6EB